MKIALPTAPSKTQYFINQAYVQYLLEAGFQPVIAYPGINVAELMTHVDGLMLPGGIDVDPIYYGQDNESSMTTDPERDAYERELFHIARGLGRPIFGICRGLQLIVREFQLHHNLLDGPGDFSQHVNFHNQVSDQNLSRTNPMHFVTANMLGLYGRKTRGPVNIPVNSMHHQCFTMELRTEAPMLHKAGLQPIAWTDRGLKQVKGSKYVVCEALRIMNWGGPILAVQWHPEELKDLELVQNFFQGSSTKKEVESDANTQSTSEPEQS